LYFLTVLKRSSVSATDMLHLYTTAIMPVLEYACPAWHNSLNTEHSCRIDPRAGVYGVEAKFRRNHIGGLESVKIRRIFRQPNYFSADFRRQ